MEFKRLAKLKKLKEAKEAEKSANTEKNVETKVEKPKKVEVEKPKQAVVEKPKQVVKEKTADLVKNDTKYEKVESDPNDPTPAKTELRKEYTKLADNAISCVKTSLNSKYVYVSDSRGYVNKFSMATESFCQKLGYLHNDVIYAMTFSDCGNYFFTSDGEGIFKQHDIEKNQLEKSYGRVLDCEIKDIAVSGDSVFIGDLYGNMKEISISEQTISKDYKKVHKSGIWSMKATANGEHLFTSDAYGYLQAWSVSNHSLIKNFGYVHDAAIRSLALSQDDKFLFSADRQGHLKQWAVRDKTLVKDYGKIFDAEILAMECSNKFLFVTSSKGQLKQFNVESMDMIEDLGKIHEGVISSITITPDSKHLFTSDNTGTMKHFRINDEFNFKKITTKVSAVFEEIEYIPGSKKSVKKPTKKEVTTNVLQEQKNLGKENVLERQASADYSEVLKEMPQVDSNLVSAVKSKVNILEKKIEKMEGKLTTMDQKLDKLVTFLTKQNFLQDNAKKTDSDWKIGKN